MNVDIFECINFCAFPKIGNFAQFIFAFLILLPVCDIIKVIFTIYIFSRTFHKRENMFSTKICKFTVYIYRKRPAQVVIRTHDLMIDVM